MVKLNEVKEKHFNSLSKLNKWIKEQPFDVQVIGVQRDTISKSPTFIRHIYILFYGQIKK